MIEENAYEKVRNDSIQLFVHLKEARMREFGKHLITFYTDICSDFINSSNSYFKIPKLSTFINNYNTIHSNTSYFKIKRFWHKRIKRDFNQLYFGNNFWQTMFNNLADCSFIRLINSKEQNKSIWINPLFLMKFIRETNDVDFNFFNEIEGLCVNPTKEKYRVWTALNYCRYCDNTFVLISESLFAKLSLYCTFDSNDGLSRFMDYQYDFVVGNLFKDENLLENFYIRNNDEHIIEINEKNARIIKESILEG